MQRRHRRITLCVLLAAILCAAGACKKKDVHEGDPMEDVDNDAVLIERKRIDDGEKVGEMLRAPKVLLTKTDLLVNGVRVGARGDLSSPVDAGRPWVHAGKVKPLYDRLRGLREH